MGPGVDPHLYKASAGDVTRLSGADVILYNGLHLEGKMADVFERMRQRGIPVFAVAEESVTGEDLIDSELFQGNYDPHIWFDVSLWQRAARRVQEILAEADPLRAAAYRERLASYLAEMDRTHAYVRERTAAIPADRRVIVTSHDAFGYFGGRTGSRCMACRASARRRKPARRMCSNWPIWWPPGGFRRCSSNPPFLRAA